MAYRGGRGQGTCGQFRISWLLSEVCFEFSVTRPPIGRRLYDLGVQCGVTVRDTQCFEWDAFSYRTAVLQASMFCISQIMYNTCTPTPRNQVSCIRQGYYPSTTPGRSNIFRQREDRFRNFLGKDKRTKPSIYYQNQPTSISLTLNRLC
jgi:hypothetical protein